MLNQVQHDGRSIAPVLETARLRLRPFRASDLDDHAASLADPAVVRYIGDHLHTREEAWRRMLVAPGMWALLGYGFWSVERKEDGRWLGQTGFGDFQRDMDFSLAGMPEMGWIFASHAHGSGYAAEAVLAAVAWGEENLPRQTFSAIIDPGNAPSQRLAERAGFRRHASARYKGEEILVYLRSPAAAAATAAASA